MYIYSESLAVEHFKNSLLYKSHQKLLTIERRSKSKVTFGTKPRDIFGIFF